MFDLFAAAPAEVRKARLAEYRQYLVERDGEVNLRDMTLSKREAAMKRFETPPTLKRALDEAQFRANYASFDTKRPPSQEMTLLLALVKTNAAEAYGVSRSIQKALQHALNSDDDVELRILVEEGYHTLHSSLPNQLPEMSDIARRLAVGERSLRRRLREEGTTYRELTQSFQYDAACSLLRNADLTLQQVAYTLGFADSTAFHRAFRRWSNLTPDEYRDSVFGAPASQLGSEGCGRPTA